MSESSEPAAPASEAPTPVAGFDTLDIDSRLQDAVKALGFETPTPIQAGAIPPLLEGRDVLGQARTGSGKTAAFGLPLLERIKDGGAVRALILAPTRELALQVTEALRGFAKKLPVRIVTIYGGASYDTQIRAIKKGASVVVGTPGRVRDLVERGALPLDNVEFAVLDEADEMLKMGFFEEVTAILDQVPRTRQMAMFSATLPPAIAKIAESQLDEPVNVAVEDTALAVDHIDQFYIRIPHRRKIDALARILEARPQATMLVFARTRRRCAEVADELAKRGLPVDALHGDLNQGARERVLARLRAERLRVVIATDVAARGIDVPHLSHVINLDIPDGPETYVHRIGRTGRAGRKGAAITFVTPAEFRVIHVIRKRLKVNIEETQIPTEREILSGRRMRLLDDLVEHSTDVDPNAADLFAELTEKLPEATTEALAVTVLSLLAARSDVRLDAATAEPEADQQDYGDTNEVELFLPVGRFAGVRPGDLVGAIATEGQISGNAIGRITILDRKSFVGMSKVTAETVLKRLTTVELRGNDVPVKLAHPRKKHDGRPPRKERPYRGRKARNYQRRRR